MFETVRRVTGRRSGRPPFLAFRSENYGNHRKPQKMTWAARCPKSSCCLGSMEQKMDKLLILLMIFLLKKIAIQ